MSRRGLIDALALIVCLAVYLGYALYLAIMLSNAGGHW